MRIIVWAPFGAGEHYWGPGTSAYRLYKSLKDNDVKVTLVHGSDSQELFPEVYDEQIKISSLDRERKLTSVLFLIKSFVWIYKNHHKYDVFHGITAFYYTFFPALYFNKFKGKTFIKITGGNGGFGENSLMSKLIGLSKYRLHKANSISGYISISSYIESNLISNGVKKESIFNIPNGVDIDRFVPVSETVKRSLRVEKGIADKFTFIYVGGLTQNKRIINIIHSVNFLKSKGIENFQFIIVGPDRSDGLVIDKVKELIKKHNLESIVIYVDHTDKPEEYFKLSDVFILVSKMEGMSNSLLEAMSCGLPAIVTKISGSEDLIKDGVNGMYTLGNYKDIACCMESFIFNKINSEVVSSNNRNKIVLNYSSDAIINKHISLFKNKNVK